MQFRSRADGGNLARGFEFLEKELAEMSPTTDKSSDTRFVDKLVKVWRKMPRRFKYVCLGTRLAYEYNTLLITDYSARHLKQSKNPFALVLLAAKALVLEAKWSPERLLDEKVGYEQYL